MMPFARMLVVIALTMGLGSRLWESPPPLAFADGGALLVSIALFAGYLYLARSLFRLPFALLFALRMMRKYRHDYGDREMVIFGFWRGFLDQTRWRGTTPQAQFDRMSVLVFTMLGTSPRYGLLLTTIGGILGLLFMIGVYFYSGDFGFLLEDPFARRDPLQNMRAQRFNLE